MSLTKEINEKKVNFEFNKEFINVFNNKIKDNDTEFLNKTLKELHPSDSADIIENLTPENRSKLIELEGFSLDPEIFIELNESIQSEIFIILSIESIANILKRLESDNALKILENLDEKKKNTVLDKLPPKDRFLLQEGLSYPEDSAARIMQREFTAIPSNWSVGQTIDYLRESKDLPEEFLEIFIVDNNFKPIGKVPSSKVLTTARESKMLSIMNEMHMLIPVKMDKEEVGHIFENYNLVSAGVIDKENK
jgi:magnesium transporter